jgi:hypothetical protein
LIEEEQKLGGDSSNGTSELTAKLTRMEVRSMECFYCGQLGNLKKVCPVLKRRQERQRDGTGEAKMARVAKYSL